MAEVSSLRERPITACAGDVPVPLPLPLYLTDTRDYIHAADLFDALVASTAVPGAARLRLVGLSDRNLQLIPGTPPRNSADVRGYFDCRDGAVGALKPHGWLCETADGRRAERLALMDEAALAGAQFAEDSATVLRRPPFTAMKTAVLLAVALLERCMPLDVLNLGEMECASAQRQGTAIEVRVTRRMAKFIMLSISLDKVPHGRIIIAATPYQEGPSA